MSVIDGAEVAFARRYDAEASGDTAPTEQTEPSGYWRASQQVIHSSGVAGVALSATFGIAATTAPASSSASRLTSPSSSPAASRANAVGCSAAVQSRSRSKSAR